MKKILLFILGIFLLTGCSKEYTEISYSQLENKLNNKETFVLLIGSDTCSACKEYERIMKKIMLDTNIEIFYINLHVLNEDESSKLYSKFVYQGTPTTIFIKNGEETSTYDRFLGVREYDVVLNKLKKLGYIR